jgi:hypothetical protein
LSRTQRVKFGHEAWGASIGLANMKIRASKFIGLTFKIWRLHVLFPVSTKNEMTVYTVSKM